MSSHEHTDDEDTTTARRMPIAALALLGLSMWAGVTFTDKATGGWAVAFVIFGGVVLVLADLVARTVAAPSELPLGVLTAAIGAPYFLWLLRRTRARHGAWA